MSIQFFSEDIAYELPQKQLVVEWIDQIIKDHQFILEELNYIFCSDEYLLNINIEHLNHDYYTDIITFDNSDEPKKIESDIFISIDRVNENCSKHRVSQENELHRVMIHGVLHLLGFKDKTEEEKKRMREKEDACLSLLFNQSST